MLPYLFTSSRKVRQQRRKNFEKNANERGEKRYMKMEEKKTNGRKRLLSDKADVEIQKSADRNVSGIRKRTARNGGRRWTQNGWRSLRIKKDLTSLFYGLFPIKILGGIKASTRSFDRRFWRDEAPAG